VSEGKLSTRGARIVKALERFADDLESGARIESKYTVRTVRVIPKPSFYHRPGCGRSGNSSGPARNSSPRCWP
jgi:hypothetical protein